MLFAISDKGNERFLWPLYEIPDCVEIHCVNHSEMLVPTWAGNNLSQTKICHGQNV
jgi:hypothetical protein